MATAGTYTQTAGAGNLTYFQDVAITPASLKDGSLRQRFDIRRYPQRGKTQPRVAGRGALTMTVNPATPIANASVTFTATFTDKDVKNPGGHVVFFDGASAIAGSSTALANGTASYTLSGGLASGAHALTAHYDGGTDLPASVSPAVNVTVA